MNPKEQRKYWLDTMLKIADPVLNALAQNKLKATMPVEHYFEEFDRTPFAHLEAFGRTMCGFTAWLEAERTEKDEKKLQEKYQKTVLLCLDHATDPQAPDFMNFYDGHQALVDAAFLAHSLVRAPKSIVSKLEERVRKNVIQALRTSRKIVPGQSNWLLFSAMVETGIYVLGGEDFDLMRVKYALRQFMQWYKGDSVYGDGAPLHIDYYNSFVIVPMLVDTARIFSEIDNEIKELYPLILTRASRYAFLLERMISPEGTYPIVGRSITYRFGAFHALAQAAQEQYLDDSLAPAQVRCALTAVIQRIMEYDGTMDENGWLRIGVYGSQPSLGEPYICTGSLYLCCAVFLPLGLSPEEAFWSGENEKWTSCKIADGEDFPKDHSIAN